MPIFLVRVTASYDSAVPSAGNLAARRSRDYERILAWKRFCPKSDWSIGEHAEFEPTLLTIQGEYWVDAETEEDALEQVRERFEQQRVGQELPDPDRISAIFPD